MRLPRTALRRAAPNAKEAGLHALHLVGLHLGLELLLLAQPGLALLADLALQRLVLAQAALTDLVLQHLALGEALADGFAVVRDQPALRLDAKRARDRGPDAEARLRGAHVARQLLAQQRLAARVLRGNVRAAERGECRAHVRHPHRRHVLQERDVPHQLCVVRVARPRRQDDRVFGLVFGVRGARVQQDHFGEGPVEVREVLGER